MKKRIRIISSLIIASYIANQPINVFAEELRNIYLNNSKGISQAKENLEVNTQNNLLNEVYLNASKSSSGSGETADTAVNTFQEALDLVSDYGSIYVSGEVNIPDDVYMPNKLIFIKQQEGGDKAKLKFEKKLYLNDELYIKNVDVEFSSVDKDCIFINEYSLELNNSEVIGEPNIFLGSEDKDIEGDTVAGLRILNDNPSTNSIGNITLGGKDNHTIENATVTLRGVNIEGIIDGSNTRTSSNVLIESSASLNKIKNVRKIDTYDHITLDIKDGLENIMELYVHGTIKLKNGSKINADYIYGSIILDVEEPSNGTLVEGNYIKSRKITGSIILSDNLIRKGYRINRVDGDDSVELNIFNKETTNISTNYEPVIKNLSKIRIKEGQTVDLKAGVKAWDFEDGDITENIVFPEIDSKTLSTGRHELTYEVTDSSNNTTTMKRIIYVLPKNASYEEPKIIGENEIELKVSQVDIFNSGHMLTGITVPADTKSINVIGEAGKPSSGQDGRYTITYELKNNNNNITKIEKTVIVTNRLPEIVANDVTIKAGEEVDLLTDSRIGLNATDYEDGDKKANIVVESNGGLNEKNPAAGEYTVVYKVVDDDNNISRKEIKVTVTSPVIKVTGITLKNSNLNLKTGKIATLTATVSPSNATNKELIWTSSDTKVATVDENGKVTAVGAGSTTITATAKDGSGKTATCKITVLSNNAPKINGAINKTIKVKDIENFDLLEGIIVTDDHDKDLKATIVSGKLEKPSAGTNKNYTITYKATDSDGNTTTATRVITVTNQVPTISGLSDITIKKGQTADLMLGVTANDYEDKNLTSKIVFPSTNLSTLSVGKHNVTYKVTDSDNNTITKTRVINVENNTITKIDLIGSTRYETAVKISKMGWNSAKTIILVNGLNNHLVDGLTATPLATALDAPILLATNSSVPNATVNEIKRLNPSKIIVIGGTGAINESVVTQLKNINKNITVKRISGKTRYETSLNIAKELDSIVPITKIYVGAGNGEPDALSISPVAGRDKSPIILTAKNSLDTNTYNYLKSKNLSDAYFIGGSGIISDNVIKQVNNIVSKNVLSNRVAGANRRETNANVIKKFYPETALKGVIIAKDLELVDALSVGPLAVKIGAPVVLAQNSLSSGQEAALKNKISDKLYQAGGGVSISVLESLKKLLTN